MKELDKISGGIVIIGDENDKIKDNLYINEVDKIIKNREKEINNLIDNASVLSAKVAILIPGYKNYRMYMEFTNNKSEIYVQSKSDGDEIRRHKMPEQIFKKICTEENISKLFDRLENCIERVKIENTRSEKEDFTSIYGNTVKIQPKVMER